MLGKLMQMFSSHEAKIYIAEKCGHPTTLCGEISAYGETGRGQLYLNERGEVDFCIECVAKATIRCVKCGQPIFVGDQITLYKAGNNCRRPSYTVSLYPHSALLIGCCRSSCSNDCVVQGYWNIDENGRGEVQYDLDSLNVTYAPVYKELALTTKH